MPQRDIEIMHRHLVVAFCISMFLAGCSEAGTASSQSSLRAGIAQLDNQNDLRVALAAISIQEMIVEPSAIPHETLQSYDLDSPEVFESKTGDGHVYVLVVFKMRTDPRLGAFVIFQKCVGGLFIRERGFASNISDSISKPFVAYASAPRNATLDYYEDDACARFSGPD